MNILQLVVCKTLPSYTSTANSNSIELLRVWAEPINEIVTIPRYSGLHYVRRKINNELNQAVCKKTITHIE